MQVRKLYDSTSLLTIDFPLKLEKGQVKIKISPVWTDGRLPLSDLDLGSGHTAYRRASLIDLYLRTKFH